VVADSHFRRFPPRPPLFRSSTSPPPPHRAPPVQLSGPTGPSAIPAFPYPPFLLTPTTAAVRCHRSLVGLSLPFLTCSSPGTSASWPPATCHSTPRAPLIRANDIAQSQRVNPSPRPHQTIPSFRRCCMARSACFPMPLTVDAPLVRPARVLETHLPRSRRTRPFLLRRQRWLPFHSRASPGFPPAMSEKK